MSKCKGLNCGTENANVQDHSLECQAQYAAACAGGRFVKDPEEPSTLDSQFDHFMQGYGATEDHTAMQNALFSLGLSRVTVVRMMQRLCGGKS